MKSEREAPQRSRQIGARFAVSECVPGREAPSDRRVHARTETREIVRYDRAGKWFVEATTSRLIPARAVSVKEAAFLAAEAARKGVGQVTFGLSGGHRFDRLVRDLLAHEHSLSEGGA